MHRLGLSVFQYISDNDDTWPSDEAWKNRAFTMDKLDGCPDAVSPSEPGEIKGVKGYSYNASFTTTVKNRRVGVSYDAIKIPMLTVAVCEEAVQHPTTDGRTLSTIRAASHPQAKKKAGCGITAAQITFSPMGTSNGMNPDDVGYSVPDEANKGAGLIPTFALKQSKKR